MEKKQNIYEGSRKVHFELIFTKVDKCILENKLKNKNRNNRMFQVVTRYLTYKNVFFEKNLI